MRVIVRCITICIMLIMFNCVIAFAAQRNSGIDEQQLQQLQSRMMSDSKVMALIESLQNDPELLALLADPVFLQAVNSRDTDALSRDPRFAKLMNNPKIREIIRLVQ